MHDISDDTQSNEAHALPLKDTHRADRRARSRAASQRQLAIAREHHQLDVEEEAGRFRKHHSLAPHHPATKRKHQPSLQELSFTQTRLHASDVSANDDCPAAA